MLKHQPYRALSNLWGVTCTLVHDPILSRIGVSGNPGAVQRHPHEINNAKRVTDKFQVLSEYLTERCKHTTLVMGRMVAFRKNDNASSKELFDWIERVFHNAHSVNPSQISNDDRELLRQARKLNTQLVEAQCRLARKIQELHSLDLIRHKSWLSRNLSKLLGTYIDFKEKGVDVKLAVDMLRLSMDDAYDDAVLFAADADYVPVARAVMKTGRRVIQAFVDVPGNPAYSSPLRVKCDDGRTITQDELRDLIVQGARPDPISVYCPECYEPVTSLARKCPHCQSELQPGTRATFPAAALSSSAHPTARPAPPHGATAAGDRQHNPGAKALDT